MRFADLLRLTTLLSAAAATALGAACVVGTLQDPGSSVAVQAVAWWLIAAIVGTHLGRRSSPSPPIAHALAEARPARTPPPPRPWATVLNRLWPLGLAVAVAGPLAFLAPPVPGIAAGFAIIWAFSWRHQDKAVVAVEERDGVVFVVARTSAFAAVKLLRVPGLRRERPEQPRGS